MAGNKILNYVRSCTDLRQAYREGEENTLAGLIPSPSFHTQRVSMKQTIADEVGAVDSTRLQRQNKSKVPNCYDINIVNTTENVIL